MNVLTALFLLTAMALSACAGLDFSHVDPEAEDFHPKRIAVLPETVGEHESARDVLNHAATNALTGKGWYEAVVNGETIKTQSLVSPDLAAEIENYLQQVNTSGISDPKKTTKIKDALQADAFFLTSVTSWEYGRQEGNKVCRVGLGIKLIDATNGTVIWKANHELAETYWVFKPKINDVADKLMRRMIAEMPH